jgi:hypothetical protein
MPGTIVDVFYPETAAADDADRQREIHTDCALHMISGNYASERVAALFGISRTVVYEWTHRALGYDENEGLRRLARDKGWL